MFAKAFTVATLASYASAHMLMAEPKPYGSPNNSPLEANGSDFPCKGAVNGGGASNTYKAGSTQQLSFIGSAVHGGGSCQVSLTTDKNPTKDSVWKVIHSIEGGCPAKNAAGNLGNNADALNPDKYDFKIPDELAAGDYVLAWTWFNHVGNREMYMNCAAVTIEGEGGSKDHLDSLPDMFVANIGNQCETAPDTDLAFPNPGSSVSKLKTKLDPPTGDGCQKPGSGSGSGSGGGSGGSAPEPSTPAAAQPTQPATTPAPGAGSGSGDGSDGAPEIPGGAFITVSKPAASQPSATQAPDAPDAPATPETPDNGSEEGSGSGEGNNGGNSGSAPDSGSGSTGFPAGSACTTEGEWNCIGGSSFQRCASGTWTPSQGLSSGVTCTPGQGADISMTVKRGERQMRHSQRHNA